MVSTKPSHSRALLWDTLKHYKKPVAQGLLSLVVIDVLEVVPPLLIKEAVDHFTDLRIVTQMALLYFLVSVIQAIGRYFWRIFLITAAHKGGKDLRDQWVGHLLKLGPRFFDRARVGDLMSMATSDVDAIRTAIGPGVLVLADAVFYLLTIPVAMFWLAPEATVWSLLPLLALPFYVLRYDKVLQARYKALQEQLSLVSAQAQEGMAGVRVVKAFAQESSVVLRFREQCTKHLQSALKLSYVQSPFSGVLEGIAGLAMVILFWVGGHEVLAQTMTLGTFIALTRFLQKMVWPMLAIGHGITYFQKGFGSAARLFEVLQENPAPQPAQKMKQGGAVGPQEALTKKALPQKALKVEFRNLSFAYPSRPDHLVLKDVSFTVEAGTRCALLGRVGSGKSTVFSLLSRLYEPPRGTIFLDDRDILDWDIGVLRSQLGVVTQDVFLFSESVIANLNFGVQEDREEVAQKSAEEVSKRAGMHEEILGLIDGYGTRLGERGVNLSGGQKQRLSIARALALRAPVLILDDALSAVDVKMEKQVIDQTESGPTLLIAAHRLSTVRLVDQLVVLEAGQVVERGSHEELIRVLDGPYAKIFNAQVHR